MQLIVCSVMRYHFQTRQPRQVSRFISRPLHVSEEKFNQSLLGLPAHLESLTLGRFFNQGWQEVTLPEGLQSLTFGAMFNRSLGMSLPDGLQSLTFGREFNQSLEGIHLPTSLLSLSRLD